MGFSDKLGDVDLASDYSHLSSETKQLIESEVRRMIDEARLRATKLLTERRKELELLAKGLVDYEVLDLEEIHKIIKGEKLPEKMKAVATASIKLPELAIPPGLGNRPVGQAGPQGGIGAEVRPGSRKEVPTGPAAQQGAGESASRPQ